MKKLMSFGLVSLSVLTLGAPLTQAATGNNGSDPITAKTEADVKFEADEGPVDPEKPVVVPPTEPGTGGGEIDPEGSDGSTGNGTKAFNINWISNFRFGTLKIGSAEMTKFAAPTKLAYREVIGELKDPNKPENNDSNSEDYNPYIKEPVAAKTLEGLANFIQVTDNRGKTENGYKVTVNATEFTGAKGALTGAQLFLTGGHLIGATESEALAPTAGLQPGTDLIVGQDLTVLSAAPGKGVGTWSLAWGGTADNPALLDENPTTGVKLVVPVSAAPAADASYKSDLTWTLISAPEINE